MLMVNALAGTGKTSTGLWGLGKRVPKEVTPSDEQKSIIKIMRTYKGTKAACAFNRSIADKLKMDAPIGCECGTSNSFGHRAWFKHLNVSMTKPDGFKSQKLCAELLGKKFEWKEKCRIQAAVARLISLCKGYMFDPNTSERENWIEGDVWTDGLGALKWLGNRFDVETDLAVLDYTCRTFTDSVKPNGFIDYDDQNFLPLYHNVDFTVYDHMLVDEWQDLNRAKQRMAFRMAKEVTGIGDVNQAIYGFSGADSESMNNGWLTMLDIDGSAQKLPLTITRRCPKSVVRLANTIVPELRCPDDAPEGKVSKISESAFHKIAGNEPMMIMCRINAPLTSLAFKLLSQGKRCYIQGRDIGTGLKSEVKKTNENDLTRALVKVHERIDRRKIEVASKTFIDDSQLEALDDKMECLRVLSQDCDNLTDLFGKIDSLFKDSGGPNDTRLSSVHKAKGLEHRKCFIYKSNKLRLRAKQKYQQVQEDNLAYVAYTRSLDELTEVYEERRDSDNEDDFVDDKEIDERDTE